MTDRAWTFESVITTPAGIRVDVTATVPVAVSWPRTGDVAELAQMCASRAIKMIEESAAEVPF